MSELFIGLMSGTSLDGVDAVLVDFGVERPRLLAHRYRPFDPGLRSEFLALNQSGKDELRRAALAANALARIYAACVQELLTTTCTQPVAVKAIGCHGQTVRHQPAAGYTIQLVNGALLAELIGIDVVCDFRSRDIAAAGHGAPLAPAFHHAVFANREVHRVIVNIGGIANITDLPANGTVTGFDCGPGNVLLDAWVRRHLKQPLDNNGTWARSGRVLPELLTKLRAHKFFCLVPPKSTGREIFNLAWLESQLPRDIVAANVQATLLALTTGTIADAIARFCTAAREVYLCGGGVRNTALVQQLAEQLKDRKVAATDVLGIDAEHVEALAFAWLAKQTSEGKTGNLPSVTGARNARVLGAIHRK